MPAPEDRNATLHVPSGVALIAIERAKQVRNGWSPEHDDQHTWGELAGAALALLQNDPIEWPWDDTEMYTVDEYQDLEPYERARIKQFVKAGALLAAEIDRLQRKYPQQ